MHLEKVYAAGRSAGGTETRQHSLIDPCNRRASAIEWIYGGRLSNKEPEAAGPYTAHHGSDLARCAGLLVCRSRRKPCTGAIRSIRLDPAIVSASPRACRNAKIRIAAE